MFTTSAFYFLSNTNHLQGIKQNHEIRNERYNERERHAGHIAYSTHHQRTYRTTNRSHHQIRRSTLGIITQSTQSDGKDGREHDGLKQINEN